MKLITIHVYIPSRVVSSRPLPLSERLSLSPSLRTRDQWNMSQFGMPRNPFLVKEEYSPNAINIFLIKEKDLPDPVIFLTRSLVRNTRRTMGYPSVCQVIIVNSTFSHDWRFGWRLIQIHRTWCAINVAGPGFLPQRRNFGAYSGWSIDSIIIIVRGWDYCV